MIVLNIHKNSIVATLTKHLTSKSKTKKYSMTTNTGELYFYLHQAPNVTWVSSNLSPTFIWAQDVEIKTEMHITISLATIKHFYILLCGKINNQIRTMQIQWSKKAIFPIHFFVFKMHLTGELTFWMIIILISDSNILITIHRSIRAISLTA